MLFNRLLIQLFDLNFKLQFSRLLFMERIFDFTIRIVESQLYSLILLYFFCDKIYLLFNDMKT